MEPVKKLTASKIIKQYKTKGSYPLLVLISGADSYIVKTCHQKKPTVEVINELICAYFAKCWQLSVPEFALIEIGLDVFQNFIKEGGALSGPFKSDLLVDRIFFGSKEISNAIEFEQYMGSISKKRDLKLFKSPLDLIKIGVFDFWVGNVDRKPRNPNILLGSDSGLFDFHPIDHALTFANQSNYRNVTDIVLRFDDDFSILKVPFVKSLINFVSSPVLQKIEFEILEGMNKTIHELDFIFSQVPPEWGLSRREKSHLKNFFSDKSRNERIARSWHYFLR